MSSWIIRKENIISKPGVLLPIQNQFLYQYSGIFLATYAKHAHTIAKHNFCLRVLHAINQGFISNDAEV